MFRELKFALRNIFRHGFNSLLTIGVMALGVVIITLLSGFYDWMFDSLKDDITKTDGHIMILKKEKGDFIDEKMLEKINSLGLFKNIVARRSISGVVGFGDKSAIFSGIALDPEKETVFRGMKERYKIKIGKILANTLGVKEGDEISGFTGEFGFFLNVEEIYSTFSPELDRFYLEVPIANIPEKKYTSVHLQLADVSKLDLALKKLKEIISVEKYDIKSFSDPGSYYIAVKTIYSNNLWFVTIVIFFLVAFSVGSVLFMELNEREKEIGTLRTFGANPLHIHKMVFYETFVMSLIAWVFGVGLSNAIGYFVNALGGIYLPPPPTVSKGFYIFFTTEYNSIINSLIVVLLSSVIVGQVLSFYFSRKEIVLQIMPRR